MDSFEYTKEELTDVMNRGLSCFIESMVAEGVLDDATADALSEYMIILDRPQTFSARIYRRILQALGVEPSNCDKAKKELKILIGKLTVDHLREGMRNRYNANTGPQADSDNAGETNSADSSPSRRINMRRESGDAI